MVLPREFGMVGTSNCVYLAFTVFSVYFFSGNFLERKDGKRQNKRVYVLT